MQRVTSVVFAAVLGCGAFAYAQSAGSEAGQVVQQYEEAFNKRDAKAIGALFTEQAMRLGSDGRAFNGRVEIEKDVAASLAPLSSDVRAAIHLGRTQQLTPDVALVEGNYEVTGGTAPAQGRYLLTAVRESGRWRIASLATVVPPASAAK